ncbi:hypothetical protein [Streptomyces sp. TLI_146]|uniref:hypothetical protein n=1 Tax=Streptomyces sp. TLI_146 TaxID=1938858 RepID=UPI000C71174D|nr:hypothetical protein [Streptomyces sp. TLI_146]PKV77052.1 hypothetical protein BX283_7978 [Streptomyces sp. TLI_146]
MPVPQLAHEHEEPVGPQQRLRELLERLTVAAGSPSGRDISRRISTGVPPEPLSHQTACLILKCERPTTEKNLLRVVRQLLRMDPCHTQLPDEERRARESEVWEEAHVLWAAWRSDLTRRAEGPLPGAFAAQLRGAVLDRPGDYGALSRRLEKHLPAEQAKAMSPNLLRAWTEGTRTPQLHELELLLRLLAEDGRALSAHDHQALMYAYFTLLRHHDPDRFRQHLLAAERDALREYTAHLESARERAVRRQQQERAEHLAALARMRGRLREAEERAQRAAVLARRRGDDVVQLTDEAESLRADRDAAIAATGVAEGQVVELRREREELGRRYVELAAVKEAEDTLARAAEEAATWPTAAEHLRPATYTPVAPDSPYTYDAYGTYVDPYTVADPFLLPGHDYADPYTTADTPTLQLTLRLARPTTRPTTQPTARPALSALSAPSGLSASDTCTAPPRQATVFGAGTAPWTVVRSVPRPALPPARCADRAGVPAEAPEPPTRPQRPRGRLRSLFRPGYGRHARPRA